MPTTRATTAASPVPLVGECMQSTSTRSLSKSEFRHHGLGTRVTFERQARMNSFRCMLSLLAHDRQPNIPQVLREVNHEPPIGTRSSNLCDTGSRRVRYAKCMTNDARFYKPDELIGDTS